ncbi:MAG TPA: helix-turn-helix transcriptional regulator [Candidatus Nitrosocosmicus sp.]|nr:helix-turn-helix transcriptional regulator [Candidatus Nitrosocosmicus sp.]
MNVVADSKSQREFGNNVRAAREKKNLSQEQVADLVGISVSYYAGIERGEENPTFAVIRQLCKVLRVKSSDILPF